MSLHQRVQSDFEQLDIESVDPIKLQLLRLVCLVVPELLKVKPVEFPNNLVVGLDSQVPDNIFTSLEAYVFASTPKNPQKNRTLLRAPTRQYQQFLTAIASATHYMRHYMRHYMDENVVAGTQVDFFFEGAPPLAVLVHWPVVTTCFQISHILNSGQRVAEDVVSAVTLLKLLLTAMPRQISQSALNIFTKAADNYLAMPQLCFVFEGTIKGMYKKRFVGKLHQKKCAVIGCWTWVDIGLPYCKPHLASKMHLELKPSNIVNAGLGVFACKTVGSDSSDTELVFSPDQYVCPYLGEILTTEQLAERYNPESGCANCFVAPYALEMNDNTFSDGACLRGVGTMLNHSDDGNCQFLDKGIIAIKPIFNGDELLVSYGPMYFQEDPDVVQTHETTICDV